jgi:hypothetical protein
MGVLELKAPPPIVALVTAVLMWLISRSLRSESHRVVVSDYDVLRLGAVTIIPDLTTIGARGICRR